MSENAINDVVKGCAMLVEAIRENVFSCKVPNFDNGITYITIWRNKAQWCC